jgi:hypothetical protein
MYASYFLQGAPLCLLCGSFGAAPCKPVVNVEFRDLKFQTFASSCNGARQASDSKARAGSAGEAGCSKDAARLRDAARLYDA